MPSLRYIVLSAKHAVFHWINSDRRTFGDIDQEAQQGCCALWPVSSQVVTTTLWDRNALGLMSSGKEAWEVQERLCSPAREVAQPACNPDDQTIWLDLPASLQCDSGPNCGKLYRNVYLILLPRLPGRLIPSRWSKIFYSLISVFNKDLHEKRTKVLVGPS